jgi:hypothetical protein
MFGRQHAVKGVLHRQGVTESDEYLKMRFSFSIAGFLAYVIFKLRLGRVLPTKLVEEFMPFAIRSIHEYKK